MGDAREDRGLALSWFAPRRFRQGVRRHVIVHLVEGVSLDGILGGVYADGVMLEAATYIRADDQDTPLDGTQVIPWQTILWVQELRDAPVRAGAQNP
jgi:hypothetical protein